MRSTRLLFLLIITQCYLTSTEADINSLEGTVHDSPNHRLSRDVNSLSQSDQWISNDGARFLRDTNEFTLTDQDDLSQLSSDVLKSKLDETQTNLEGKETEEKRIQGELDTARKASQAANTTLAKAELDWKAALAEMNRLEEPFREVNAEISAKREKLQDLEEALFNVEVSFPPEVQDKNAHALNASNFAQQTLPVVKQRIKELDEKKTEWEKARDEKETEKKAEETLLNALRSTLQQENCPAQKADTESKDANGRPKRLGPDCTRLLQMAEAANKQLTELKSQLTTAETTLKNGKNELQEKKRLNIHLQNELVNWQAYSGAFNNVSLAVEELKKAKKNGMLEKLNKAKEAAPRLSAVYTGLEAKLTAATTEVENAKSIRNYYQSKYNDQTTPTPDDAAGPPLGLIVGCIVGALAVAAGAGAAFYFLWWKKRKTTGKKENTKDDEDDDSDGSKEGGKKDKVKAKKSEKTKSDKTKSDEAQKSDEKKEEKEKSKPDDPSVKVACGMKYHGNNEVKEDAKDDNDTDKSKEDSKGGKMVYVKSEKTKSDEVQKSGEKKDEIEKSRPELLEKSKPDDPVVKVACGMKSHGKADEVIIKTSREHKIDEDYAISGLEAEKPSVTGNTRPTETVDLEGRPQDKEATFDARLEWEQPDKFPAKSQSKMDPTEIHRQVLHFLGSMDFHKINDLISRNNDYRIPSIELDASGQIGYTITGRCDTIKTEDDMEGYYNHHTNERSQFNDGILIRGY